MILVGEGDTRSWHRYQSTDLYIGKSVVGQEKFGGCEMVVVHRGGSTSASIYPPPRALGMILLYLSQERKKNSLST